MKIYRLKKLFALILASLMVVSACSPMTAFAIDGKYDSTFYSNNDIVIYDPTDTGCPSQVVGQLSGIDNRQKIYNYWITQGLKPAQAAGITGAIQQESGFNPFYQQPGQTWPAGGYGIADFQLGQRTAVTAYIESKVDTIVPTNFATYYIPTYGGATSSSTGYAPVSVPTPINDDFLVDELDYLSQTYLPGLAPNPTLPDRVAALTKDQSLTIPSGTKLLDYIKTLATPEQVAAAWVYLYDYPTVSGSTTLATITASADSNAESILKDYGSTDNSSSGCSTVGVGGLSYAQAQTLMQFYSVYTNRVSYIAGSFKSGVFRYQCTTFVDYFNNRFVTADSGAGNGYDVANNLLKKTGYYQSVTQDNLVPFTTFSVGSGEPGHTGVILGIESDGSIVVGEANITIGNPAGLIEKTVYGSKSNLPNGVSAAEHWKSVTAWLAYMKSIHYPPHGFAAPINESTVASNVQASLGVVKNAQ